MRLHLTKKQVIDGSAKVFSAGYCRLRNTLYNGNYIGYTSGKFGWNADIFDLGDNITIVTGYRTFGKPIPDDIIKECNALAENESAVSARFNLKKWCMEN